MVGEYASWMREAYTVLCGKPEGLTQLARRSHKYGIII
jgi:hypothetical protein